MSTADNTAMRTHRCGDINTALEGNTVTVAGWAHRVRNLGGLVFIDVRDRWGEVQVVCEDQTSIAAGGRVKLESVLRVTGVVRPRPADMVNPDKPTGAVELAVRELELLNGCDPLPFQFDQIDGVEEEMRLRYRYPTRARPVGGSSRRKLLRCGNRNMTFRESTRRWHAP